jgi:hypothetical protein
MPSMPTVARAALCAVLLPASGAAAAQSSWAPWHWPVFDRSRWDARCGEARFVQLHASGPLYNFGDEGEQYRLGAGLCAARFGAVSLQLDGVLSPIRALPHQGAGGGRAVGLGVDAVLRWRLGAQRLWFAEAGGGLQYAIGPSFPADGTHFQFTVIGGVGRSVAIGPGRTIDVGLRWFHISNANLLPGNSGYDSIQLTVGVTLPLGG